MGWPVAGRGLPSAERRGSPRWRDKTIAPSTQGHHWNHSAESYFLIGKAMGDNTVNLLTP